MQVIIAGLVAAGGITGILKLFSFGVGLWKSRQKAKLAEAIEVKRLGTEAAHIDNETIKASLLGMLEERKAEVTELKLEIIELKQSHSLSRQRVPKLYEAIRKIRQQIDIISETVRQAQLSPADKEAVTNEIDILRGRIGELDQILP